MLPRTDSLNDILRSAVMILCVFHRYMNIGDNTAPSMRYSSVALSPRNFPTRHWLDDTTPTSDIPPSPMLPDGRLRTSPTLSSTWQLDSTPNLSDEGSSATFGSDNLATLNRMSSQRSRAALSLFDNGQMDSFCDEDELQTGAPGRDRSSRSRPPTRWGPRTRLGPSTDARDIVRRDSNVGVDLRDREGSGVVEELHGERWPPALLAQHILRQQVDERPMYQNGGGSERRAESAERERVAGTSEGQRQRSDAQPTLDGFMREIAEMIQTQRALRAAVRLFLPPLLRIFLPGMTAVV